MAIRPYTSQYSILDTRYSILNNNLKKKVPISWDFFFEVIYKAINSLPLIQHRISRWRPGVSPRPLPHCHRLDAKESRTGPYPPLLIGRYLHPIQGLPVRLPIES